MIALWMAISLLTLNINGLHNYLKWLSFWQEIPRKDIICIQESHLMAQQECSFSLHAQSFDFFFSHGSSNSAGVLVAFRCNTGVIPVKAAEIAGRLLVIDFDLDQCRTRLINLYALNNLGERATFFQDCFKLITDCMILLGDFNSVEHITDHFSQRLDDTSSLLNSSLDLYHFSELMGSHRYLFTYHHPTVATCKSRLDRIYLNFSMPRCQGFS